VIVSFAYASWQLQTAGAVVVCKVVLSHHLPSVSVPVQSISFGLSTNAIEQLIYQRSCAYRASLAQEPLEGPHQLHRQPHQCNRAIVLPAELCLPCPSRSGASRRSSPAALTVSPLQSNVSVLTARPALCLSRSSAVIHFRAHPSADPCPSCSYHRASLALHSIP
jgi:hypothetical protein